MTTRTGMTTMMTYRIKPIRWRRFDSGLYAVNTPLGDFQVENANRTRRTAPEWILRTPDSWYHVASLKEGQQRAEKLIRETVLKMLEPV